MKSTIFRLTSENTELRNQLQHGQTKLETQQVTTTQTYNSEQQIQALKSEVENLKELNKEFENNRRKELGRTV